MHTAVVSRSLAVVGWFRMTSCTSLLVVLAMGFTVPLILWETSPGFFMKSGFKALKRYFYHILMVRANHKDSTEINTVFGQRKYHYRMLGCTTQSISSLSSYFIAKSLPSNHLWEKKPPILSSFSPQGPLHSCHSDPLPPGRNLCFLLGTTFSKATQNYVQAHISPLPTLFLLSMF